MTDTMNTQQAARHYRVSERTILRWIKSGKLKAEQVQGRWVVCLDEPDVIHDGQDLLTRQLQSENAHLREQLVRRDEQIDRFQQLLAMQTKNTAALAEQLETERRKIEDMRHRSWVKRIFR